MGLLDKLWPTISNVQLSDRSGPSADQENARKRAQAIAPSTITAHCPPAHDEDSGALACAALGGPSVMS